MPICEEILAECCRELGRPSASEVAGDVVLMPALSVLLKGKRVRISSDREQWQTESVWADCPAEVEIPEEGEVFGVVETIRLCRLKALRELLGKIEARFWESHPGANVNEYRIALLKGWWMNCSVVGMRIHLDATFLFEEMPVHAESGAGA